MRQIRCIFTEATRIRQQLLSDGQRRRNAEILSFMSNGGCVPRLFCTSNTNTSSSSSFPNGEGDDGCQARAAAAMGAVEELPPRLSDMLRVWRERLLTEWGNFSDGQQPFVVMPLLRFTHNVLELSKTNLRSQKSAYIDARLSYGDRVTVQRRSERQNLGKAMLQSHQYEVFKVCETSVHLRLLPGRAPVHNIQNLELGEDLSIKKVSAPMMSVSRNLEFLEKSARWFLGQTGYELILFALGVKHMPFPSTPDPLLRDLLSSDPNAMITFHKDLKFDTDKRFNAAQIDAISAACNPHRPYVVVHGPAASGKMQVAAETIVQLLLSRDKRVLVCASSKEQMYRLFDLCQKRLRRAPQLANWRSKMVLLTGTREHPRHMKRALEAHPDWANKLTPLYERLNKLELRRNASEAELAELRKKVEAERARICAEAFWETRVFFYVRNASSVSNNVCHEMHVQLIMDEESLGELECLNIVRLAPRAVLFGDPAQDIRARSAQSASTLGQQIWRKSIGINSSGDEAEGQILSDEMKTSLGNCAQGSGGVCHWLGTRYAGIRAVSEWIGATFYAQMENFNHALSNAKEEGLSVSLLKTAQLTKLENTGASSQEHSIVFDLFDNTSQQNQTAKKGEDFVAPKFNEPVLLVDVDQISPAISPFLFCETYNMRLKSFYNSGQALLTVGYILSLLERSGFAPAQIAVSAIGCAQIALIKQILLDTLCDEAFVQQIAIGDPLDFKSNGWRRDVVIGGNISNAPIQSATARDLFLRRLNVVSSSAQHQFVFIDSVRRLRECFSAEMDAFLDFFQQKGRIVAGMEMIEEPDLSRMLNFIADFNAPEKQIRQSADASRSSSSHSHALPRHLASSSSTNANNNGQFRRQARERL